MSRHNDKNVVTTFHTEASEQAHFVPYTQISNEFIRNTNLPAETRLLLIYLLSFPESHKFDKSVIQKEMRIGRDKLGRMLEELVSLGYMKKVQSRRADGSFSQLALYASDKPIFNKENNN